MRVPLLLIGLTCLIVAIWIGLPMIGMPIFSTIWLRAVVTAVVIGPILIMQIIRWRKRRAAAREIEDALTPTEPEGDGKVLGERMNEALATLKKSGGASYLYDLPWYVIIGPPGAGKTTALRNSGIEFPLSNADDAGVVSGFGGTRYCDWWFAEDAILIDTAGRYTTQDSDKAADESSWQSFLELLKKSRPNQPINGVILAFSVEDMMNATPEDLARHSEIVRTRLAEVHDKLRIDFPVYVLFTKCDLISGFREYFSSFSLGRRKSVWGVTFQTKDRKAQTHEQVPEEFDQLVSRLSDEIIDRLTEEPDGISRIAIFGLPGQMALLRENVTDFLRRVFEPTRYKTSAILRGFYFTSGTQEGTPIDQVLGAMSNNDQAAGAFAPAFMSGQGKSFFLHDLLRKVIFEERDWVSHDVRAVRRAQILRALGLSAIGLTTAAALILFAVSFWQNRNLVNAADVATREYANDAQREIARTEIEDWELTPILPYLQDIRTMPSGYGAAPSASRWDGFGLGQRGRLGAAATNAYSDALEQMLRPRLILDVERRLPELRDAGEPAQIYRALKVYMLLAGQGPRRDDLAIKTFFEDIWRQEFTGVIGFDQREQLIAHLDAMLTLDDTRDIAVPIDDTVVTVSRSAIVQMSLADQAYAIISDTARQSSLPAFNLLDATGPQAEMVFTTLDGSNLGEIEIEPLYTYDGFWEIFMEELINVRQVLEDDKWVLGDQANAVNFDNQLLGLDRALHARYANEFEAAWKTMFDQFRLANMVADKPQYDVLGAAAGQFSSPIVQLANAIERETKLTRFLDELAEIDPAEFATGGAGGAAAGQVMSRFRSGSSGLQRILLDAVTSGNKNQNRVNGSPDDGGPRGDAENVEQRFELWHLMLDASRGARPIDEIFVNLSAIRDTLRLAQRSPVESANLLEVQLNDLTRNKSRLPAKLAEFVEDAERDFRSDASDATIVQMNRALTNNITFNCRQGIEGRFPFSNNATQVALNDFGNFFGYGGDMDQYFNTYLDAHVIRGEDGYVFDPSSPLADRLSENMLRQFYIADKIKRAFFTSGEAQPEVPISFTVTAAHSTIEKVQLGVNGERVELLPEGSAQTVVWPGAGSGISLNATPREVGVNERQIGNGKWAIVQFVRQARDRVSRSNGVRLTQQLGGRTITFDMEFTTADNPFTMPELQNFACPQSVN